MGVHKAETMGPEAFEAQVVGQGRTTLACFLEDWSAPCKSIGQAVDALSDALYGQAEVYRMNLDEAPLVAARYGISSIPALVLFVKGEPVQKLYGLRSYEEIMKTLAKHLPARPDSRGIRSDNNG